MGCTRCGTDAKLVTLLFNKLMHEALADGTLQAGLVSCDKEKLEKSTRVVTCESLSEKVCDLFESGQICLAVPSGLSAIDDPSNPGFIKLTLIMSDGSTFDTKIKTGGITKAEVESLISKAVDPLNAKITALEQKAKALQDAIDAIPTHAARVEITDGTGTITLAHGHETEAM